MLSYAWSLYIIPPKKCLLPVGTHSGPGKLQVDHKSIPDSISLKNLIYGKYGIKDDDGCSIRKKADLAVISISTNAKRVVMTLACLL